MKNLKSQIKQSFLVLLLVMVTFIGFGQHFAPNTAGKMTFSVKTITNNGNYSPKHVLAIWVEDENGFVKSRLVRANNRKQYLYTWKAASSNNETDATTGATLTSHQTRTVAWDCTDLDGNEVPDGEYTIRVEFTDKHAQGPLTAVTFTKGIDEQHLTPADEDHFINITLDYIPEITGIIGSSNGDFIHVYPNPGAGIYNFKTALTGDLTFEVLDITGKMCVQIKVPTADGLKVQELDLTGFKNGIYFVRISNNTNSTITKIIKQ